MTTSEVPQISQIKNVDISQNNHERNSGSPGFCCDGQMMGIKQAARRLISQGTHTADNTPLRTVKKKSVHATFKGERGSPDTRDQIMSKQYVSKEIMVPTGRDLELQNLSQRGMQVVNNQPVINQAQRLEGFINLSDRTYVSWYGVENVEDLISR